MIFARYFNKFVQNLLGGNTDMIISDLRGYGGCYVEAKNTISRRTLWHFKPMFGSSHSASSAYQETRWVITFSLNLASISWILEPSPQGLISSTRRTIWFSHSHIFFWLTFPQFEGCACVQFSSYSHISTHWTIFLRKSWLFICRGNALECAQVNKFLLYRVAFISVFYTPIKNKCRFVKNSHL